MNGLILAKLSEDQILKAKEVNGKNNRMTHVLICGKYGQRFGTEKQCLKYFDAWKDIFKDLFNEVKRLDSIEEIPSYETTFDLVNILIKAQDKLPTSTKSKLKKLTEEAGVDLDEPENDKPEKKSFLKRLFR